MKEDQVRKLARQLAYDWARVERPNPPPTYTDYLTTLVGLATVIDNANRASAIFLTIIERAQRMGRSSARLKQSPSSRNSV